MVRARSRRRLLATRRPYSAPRASKSDLDRRKAPYPLREPFGHLGRTDRTREASRSRQTLATNGALKSRRHRARAAAWRCFSAGGTRRIRRPILVAARQAVSREALWSDRRGDIMNPARQ